ncbi:hypothetical protein SK128_011575 [Halocaridina rubra]|uniref:Secreted protein n=1 Tax=Halocaridina rubra TaxID=373956 RepID=A0AAN9A4Q5_HALRR
MHLTAGLCLVGLIACGAMATFPGAGTKKSWIDTSLCLPDESPDVCQMKKSNCSGVNKAFIGPGGPVGAVIKCANTSGIAPKPEFFMNIGLAFMKGTPEKLSDTISPNPKESSAIRMCVLNNTGLLTPNMATDRDAIAAKLNASLKTPAFSEAAMEAVYSCPEPNDFHITDFMNCIKFACMNDDAVNPFMSSGKSGPFTGGAPVGALRGGTSWGPPARGPFWGPPLSGQSWNPVAVEPSWGHLAGEPSWGTPMGKPVWSPPSEPSWNPPMGGASWYPYAEGPLYSGPAAWGPYAGGPPTQGPSWGLATRSPIA